MSSTSSTITIVSPDLRDKWVENIFIRMKECLEPFVGKGKLADLKDDLVCIEANNPNIRAYIHCILCAQVDSDSPNVYLSCKIRGFHHYWNIENFKRHLGRNHQTNTKKLAHNVRKAGKQKTETIAIDLGGKSAGNIILDNLASMRLTNAMFRSNVLDDVTRIAACNIPNAGLKEISYGPDAKRSKPNVFVPTSQNTQSKTKLVASKTKNKNKPSSIAVSTIQQNKWMENIFIRMKEYLEPFVEKKKLADLKDGLVCIETHPNVRAYIHCILCAQFGSDSPNVYLSCKIRGDNRYWNIENFKRHLDRNHQMNRKNAARDVRKFATQKAETSAIDVAESAGNTN